MGSNSQRTLVVRVGDTDNPDAWTSASAEMVEQVLVDTPAGAKIPLKVLAGISPELGPNMMSRENAQRSRPEYAWAAVSGPQSKKKVCLLGLT